MSEAEAQTTQAGGESNEAEIAAKPIVPTKKRKLPQTNEEKLAEAARLKDEGNGMFKAGRYKKAVVCYNKVFAYIWQPSAEVKQYAKNDEMTKEQASSIVDLRLACWGNIANCHLKLENPRKCLEYCKKILEEDEQEHSTVPTNQKVKALVRSGQAMLLLNDLDKSKALLTQAHSLDPQNASVRSEWKKLQNAFKEHKAKEKAKFGGMFNA
jgi:tetratricopeptide (TPR) repeat protein